MSQTDMEVLLDMGFDKARAEIAVKKSGGLQGALEWLERKQDKTIDEITAEEAEEAEGQAKIAALGEGGVEAKSITCNECGKRFKNQDLAQYHATKTDHTDFSESAEEIAPLTEEEKKAKLEELRLKLADKKASQADQEKETVKKNEQIRQKSTKESQDAKEELERKEQLKEVALKRQEKAADLMAKQRIRAKIEADKEERRRKAEQAKAIREGRAPESGAAASAAETAAPAAPKPATAAAAANEARLRLQTPTGSIIKTLPAETTLFEVAEIVKTETGSEVTKIMTTFPRKVFEGPTDFAKTLREAGMVPNAALVVT